MMKLCIEGWRTINHSYAMTNQRQLIELDKLPIILKHKDMPYYNQNWNELNNSSGFSKADSEIVKKIKAPSKDEIFDVMYRIFFPYNFEKSKAEKLFVFGTAEYQNIDDLYVNGNPKEKNIRKNLKIITPSNWSKKGFVRGGFDSEQVIVLPHGIDRKSYYLIEDEKKNRIKENLGINSNDFVISSVGAMTQNKGIDYLLVAFFILKKKYKNLKLILKDQSNLYQIYASQHIEKMKTSKYANLLDEKALKDIIIISKNLPVSELNELYNISDCYVSPYRAEGFNIPPLEAAACGTPIIVTKGGSTDDYFNSRLGLQIESKLIHNQNNTMLDPNLDSLIECISSILHKTNKYDKKNASKYVHDNYNWEKIIKKLFIIFNQ